MTPKEVMSYYGTCYQFNKRTGMNEGTLRAWMKTGVVTKTGQILLEQLTGGELKASRFDSQIAEIEHSLKRIDKKISQLQQKRDDLILKRQEQMGE